MALDLVWQMPPSQLVGQVHIPQMNAAPSLLPCNSGSAKAITLKKSFLGSAALVAAQHCRLQPTKLKMVQRWRAELSRAERAKRSSLVVTNGKTRLM